MSKTYVLDTNIILHHPEALFSFKENNIVIPAVVVKEVEKHKCDVGEVGANAREFGRIMMRLRKYGSLAHGVPLGDDLGMLYIEHNFELGMLELSNDNIILGCTRMLRDGGINAILVTNDIFLIGKADLHGIEAQEYIGQKVDTSKIGEIKRIETDESMVDSIYAEGSIPAPDELLNGMSVIVGSKKKTVLARVKNNELMLVRDRISSTGIKGRNAEQKLLMSALMDESVDMVICSGVAGSGKTLLSMACGVEQVENGKFYKVFITKSIVPVGNDIGFVKGTKDEKMAEWVKPFTDNLDFIYRGRRPNKKGLDEDMWDDIIEVDAITYVRGRSLMDRFIIVDEVQNLHPRIVKTLMSRVADSSKLVLLGDLQQIDNPSLNITNNGLAYAMSRLAGNDNIAIFNMQQSERGRLAEMAVELL